MITSNDEKNKKKDLALISIARKEGMIKTSKNDTNHGLRCINVGSLVT